MPVSLLLLAAENWFFVDTFLVAILLVRCSL